MEHTSGALRSRNSASLAPEHVSGRQNASMVGREVVLGKNNRTSQAVLGGSACVNVNVCLCVISDTHEGE